jgi:hypothetical protein
MPLKLNKIADDIVRENIVNNRARVESFLAADNSSPMRADPVRYSRRLADAALELGLGLHQQESDREEIRRNLALAGAQLCSLFLLDSPKAALSPLEFEKALALSTCFCPPGVYQSLSTPPSSRFFADPKALAFYEVLAHYLDVARNFVTSGQLDRTALNSAVAECQRSNAGRYDAQVNLAKLKALEAIDGGDAESLNQSIAILIADHENEALRGENQRSTRGFLSLPALMFANLGATRNLVCTIESPYLPLPLLGQ